MQNTDRSVEPIATQTNPLKKKKLWRRVTAGIMALVLLCSLILGYMVQIRFAQLSYVNTVLEEAAAVTAANTSYLNENGLKRAWKILRYAVGKPGTYEEYEMYTSLAIARTEYAEAIPYMQGCIDLYEGDSAREKAVLYLRLGSLYALSDDAQNAITAFDQAIAADDTLAEAYLLRAQMKSLAGLKSDMAADIRRYDQLTGEDPALAESLGGFYESAGDYENAARCYTLAMDYVPENPVLLASRGRCYVLLQKLEPAMQDLTKYFAAGGTDPTGEYSLMLGLCQMEAGEYAKAVNAFHNSLKAGYSQQAMVLSQCVLCAYILGDYETVIADGQKCLEALKSQKTATDTLPVAQDQMTPEEVFHWMGLARMAQEDFQGAKNEFQRVEDLTKAPEGVLYYLGLCCASLDQQDEAIQYYTRSIEAGQMTSLCLYNRGVSYLQQEKLEEGLTDLITVIQRNDDADALSAAASLLNELGVNLVFEEPST